MINPEDATMIDARDSYSIDECVAKMIGWMQGAERLYRVELDEFGFPPDKLPHIYCLVYPLEKHLDQLHERARVALLEAAEAYGKSIDGTPEHELLYNNLDLKHKSIEDCSDLIKKAHFYKSEIRKELNKADSSKLKIDRVEKNDKEEELIFIKLDSLDEWAKKFDISIIEQIFTTPQSTIKSKNLNLDKQRGITILKEIVNQKLDPLNLPIRIPGKKWVKSNVLKVLQNDPLFPSVKIFDTVWSRLSTTGKIKETEPKTKKN